MYFAYYEGTPYNSLALKAWREGVLRCSQKKAAAWYGVHERTWRRYECGDDTKTLPDRLWKRIKEYTQLTDKQQRENK